MFNQEILLRVALPTARSPCRSERLATQICRTRRLRVTARRIRWATALAVVLFWTSPASAQQFGQWSWEALFGTGQRAYQNFIDGQKASSFDQRDLRFALGVKGFIIHPAVASFRVGMDGFFSGFAEKKAVDTSRWGLRGDIRLFPQGRYRIHLFGGREIFGYATDAPQDFFIVRGIPDTSTTLGGRLRVRGGLLNGVLIGLERSNLHFIDQEAKDEIHQRDFIDWTGAGGTLQRHFRLERRFRDFGSLDFKNNNITGVFDQHGPLSDAWRWNLHGNIVRQSLAYRDDGQSSYNTFRVRNQFLYTTSGNDVVDLSYSGGLFYTTGEGFQSHASAVRYRYRLSETWEVTPFTAFGLRLSAKSRLQSPQIGVSSTWSADIPSVDLVLTNSVSLAWLRRRIQDVAWTDFQAGVGLSGSIGHGSDSDLRKEVEASWSRNQLYLGQEAIIIVPELEVPVLSGLSEDFLRARVTLRRQWHSLLFSGYSEWTRRQPTAPVTNDGYHFSGSTQSLQVSSTKFNVLLNLGRVTSRLVESQDVRYFSTHILFRPWRLLALNASYRDDFREVLLAPDVDGERVQAGADLRLGAFEIQIRAFTQKERRLTLGERTNRGVTWTLLRQFQGWLPFVTTGRRRGAIR